MDITSLVKDYVSSVCKGAGLIEIKIQYNDMYICIDDTALAKIPIMQYLNDCSMAFVYHSNMVVDDNTPYDRRVSNKIANYIQTCEVNNAIKSPIVAECGDLRAIPEYETLLQRKADDGAGFYVLPGINLYQNYMIPVFAGFPNINKSDSVGIVVRKSDIDPQTLINEYCIYKKKIDQHINLYFRSLDLNVSLRDNTIYNG